MLRLIHPGLVHATVSFLVVGGLTELFGIARRREAIERFGGILVVLGTALLAPTVAAGYLAQNSLTLSAAQAAAVDDHERFGLLALGVFVPLLIAKAWGRGRPPERLRGPYAAGLVAGVALTAAAAYAGGLMVYELGVGVTTP